MIERARGKWAEGLERWLTDAAAVYRAAIVAMEEARNRLVEEVLVGSWLTQFPEQGAQPQVHTMPPNPHLAGDHDLAAMHPPRRFTEIRDDLIRDSETLPSAGPLTPSPEFLRMLGQPGFAAEFVDGEGRRRTRWLRGGSEGQHRAHEAIARIDAEISKS
jgi:hypothetical protein